ncbi:MAG: glycosyltransferase [Anaerolineae bacterium]|nr:glycosyltransferase [Anaerolineae bacterium]
MHIAYISLHWPRTTKSGVGKKIMRQIGAWREAGHDVQFFMHTVQRDLRAPLLPGEVFYYRGEWQRIQSARRLLKAVCQYQPDIIYLRYGMYVYPIHRLASIAPLVEELNTNDIIQHKRLGLIYNWYNRLTRRILINNVSGLVCLSSQLATMPQNAVSHNNVRVIGDGINLDETSPLPAPKNSQPRIAFIGSPDSPWQGVDKLPQLALSFPDISIHIIGYNQIDGHDSIPENLHLYGYLDTVAYNKILGTMDCAISSLGLHRIQLDESSPLKTRECLALGLPMVLPYKDTDLHNFDCDFLLKIPNKEDNIQTHAQAIRDFAYRMRGHRVDRKLIESIDQAIKERERLRFFKDIISIRS